MTQLESADRTLQLLERGLSEASGSQKLRWLSVPAPLLRSEALLGVAPHADAWYWSNGGDHEFVGVGVAQRLTAHGPDRFESIDRDLQQLWRSLEPHATTEAGAPEPRVVGGFAFQPGRASQPPWNDFGEAQLVLPRLTYTRRDDRAWLSLIAAPRDLASHAERARFLNEAAELVAAARHGSQPELETAPGPFELAERGADEWREQIAQVERAIATGAFQKVVLARRVLVRFAGELSAARTLARLRESGPLAPRFAFRVNGATFIGSPPERLLAKAGLHLETEAVAGTLPAADAGAAEQLLSDPKLLAEHAPVVQDLVERLRPVADLKLPPRPLPHRARHVLHLKTSISATLRAPERALALLSRIHPTPAVGGYPTQPALGFIAEHEPDERGWYSGPIGWIDARDNADFAVALRSGVIVGKQAHLYVGAGIVSGSDSESELLETSWKLKVLLSALG